MNRDECVFFVWFMIKVVWGLWKIWTDVFFFTVDWGCVVILNRCKKCIHITNEDTDQTPTCVAKGAWKVTASEGSSDKSLIY